MRHPSRRATLCALTVSAAATCCAARAARPETIAPAAPAPRTVVLVSLAVPRGAPLDAVQQRVLDALPPGHAAVRYRYRHVAGLALAVDAVALRALARAPGVRRIHPDVRGGGALWTSAARIGVPRVRARLGLTGKGVLVLPVDSGVRSDHPDLAAALAGPGWHALHQGLDVGAGAEDLAGHGTAMAGIVASAGTVSPPGVAPGAALLPVQVLDAAGAGWVSDWVAGIEWAVDQAAALGMPAVMLLSLSTYTTYSACPCDGVDAATALLAEATTLARDAGITVIAAAGNGGQCDAWPAPACTAAATAVTATYDVALGREPDAVLEAAWSCTDATTAPDQLPCFANAGPCVDLAAPGYLVATAGLHGATTLSTGTSAAAAHAAGVAALALQQATACATAAAPAAVAAWLAAGPGAWGACGALPRLDAVAAMGLACAGTVGACCDAAGACAVEDAASCAASGGLALPPGVDCGGDCDGDGVADACAPDCDGDGLPDACALAAGLASDCDGDGVPDACQPGGHAGDDCDGDGTSDRCAIAAGATDDDADGVPDACEIQHVAWVDAAAANDGTPGPDGTPAQPYPTLQAGIDAVSGLDGLVEVRVLPGTYAGPGNEDVALHGAPMAVRCTEPGACVLALAPGHRAFVLDAGETRGSRIEGFRIVGGLAVDGGAVLVDGSAPTLRHLEFAGSAALGRGGAIFVRAGSPRIVACSFSATAAKYGGAIALWHARDAELADLAIAQAEASATGGAVLVAYTQDVHIHGVEMTGASAGTAGGALAASSSTLLVTSSIAAGCATLGSGGGLHLVDTAATLWGTTIAHDTAPGEGTALWLEASAVEVVASIVHANAATFGPAGTASTRLEAGATLVRRACDWTGTIATDATSTVTTGAAMLAVDPLLADPTGATPDPHDDFRLLETSPCIDAVPPDEPVLAARDVDGDARPLGAALDMGADEVAYTDGDPCTEDACAGGTCTHTPAGGCCDTPQGCDRCAMAGDLTGDGAANVVDVQCGITAVVSSWASTGGLPPCLAGPTWIADVTCDGSVDVADVLLLIARALGNPLDPALDGDADGCPDACG